MLLSKFLESLLQILSRFSPDQVDIEHILVAALSLRL